MRGSRSAASGRSTLQPSVMSFPDALVFELLSADERASEALAP
jgi:hypothetical protein